MARNRLLLSVVAVIAWGLITVGPALLPHEPGSLVDLISHLTGGIVINSLLAIVALAVFALALRWTDLGFVRPRPWRSLWLLWLPGLYLLLFYGLDVVVGVPPLPTLGLLFVNTLLVGVSEELAFRGVLFRGLRSRLPMWPSVLVSAAAFGAMHVLNALSFGNLFLAGIQAVAAAMTGVLFVALVIRTNSIIPAMALHALWDFGTLLLVTSALQKADAAAAAGATAPQISPLLFLLPVLFNLPNFLFALFLLRRKGIGATSAPAAEALPAAAD